jgi:DNA helicase-2/ATP-dependent DNA helicase PcrA
VKLLDEIVKLDAPAAALDRVLKSFYDDYLVSHYENANLRREDLKGLADFASQYHTIPAFLSDVALSGEFSGETVVSGPEEMEFVTLSTVHQAKGLEWPVVLIPWLADGRFPTDLAINTQEELEEERRVFHVAVTRAKDELFLTFPLYRPSSGDDEESGSAVEEDAIPLNLLIAKQRNGPTGDVKLVFKGEYTRFFDAAKTTDEDAQEIRGTNE